MSEQVPEFGGCRWPVDPGCFDEKWQAMDEGVQDRALAYASATLERLSGRRVGHCPTTVRPVPERGCCFVPFHDGSWLSPGMNVQGQWVNSCGYAANQIDVSNALELPWPIGRVDEVKIDGDVVPPNQYWIQSHRFLRLFSGAFPLTQDVTKPDTEEGTFSVTYLNAWPVDSLAANAAATLALEFALACIDSDECRLPEGVTQIVRQGISMTIASGAFPGGETGIREVDAWIALWNPKHLTQGAKVWTPDQQVFL